MATHPIIAFSGISGSGKSALAKILATTINASCISEPEENQWPEIARDTCAYGAAQALLAFRQIWAKMFLDAQHAAIKKTVVLDTYFFKIFGYYLQKPGMQFLLPGDDPYMQVLLQLNQLDRSIMPDAHVVVLFYVTMDDWKLFLASRARQWDAREEFGQSYERTTRYVADATIEHCKKNSIQLIHFKNEFGNAYQQAEKLRTLLAAQRVIAV